jgi:hypothetical protein
MQAGSPAAKALVSSLDAIGARPDVVYKISGVLKQRPPAECKSGDFFKIKDKGLALLDFTVVNKIEVDDDQDGLTCVTAVSWCRSGCSCLYLLHTTLAPYTLHVRGATE